MKARRDFLKFGARSLSWFVTSNVLISCSGSGGGASNISRPPVVPPPTPSGTFMPPPLLAANSDGLMLPTGFTSRIVATSSTEPLQGNNNTWHSAPDGGATYPVTNGGWVYVSNSERSNSAGGVGALRFASDGTLTDTYPILTGTSRNCAGGATPWTTWLSCEETSGGFVYECDPLGVNAAQVRPALGAFRHEAVAVDTTTHILYLTEDEDDGRFYRFRSTTPNVGGTADLSDGILEVMQVTNGGPEGPVTWLPIPDPSAAATDTRLQVPQSTAFDGGEGVAYDTGSVFFVTKGDNRVWSLDIAAQTLSIVYDRATSATPILSGVDNVTVGSSGEVLVAEDGGNMQIVVLASQPEAVFPLVQVVGHDSSEITGPAFTPDFTRLYFSSQRGSSGSSSDGVTFEVTGPFSALLS